MGTEMQLVASYWEDGLVAELGTGSLDQERARMGSALLMPGGGNGWQFEEIPMVEGCDRSGMQVEWAHRMGWSRLEMAVLLLVLHIDRMW